MNSDRMRILTMLEQGKINAKEALKLLDSVDESAGGPGGRRRSIRVKIDEGGDVYNVKVPIRMAKSALGIASRFGGLGGLDLGGLDLDLILEEIEKGAEGHIATVDDGEKKIEVFLE